MLIAAEDGLAVPAAYPRGAMSSDGWSQISVIVDAKVETERQGDVKELAWEYL